MHKTFSWRFGCLGIVGLVPFLHGEKANGADENSKSAVRTSIQPASSVVKASEELLSLQEEIRQVRAQAEVARVAQDKRLKELLDDERFVGRALENRKGELAKSEKEAAAKREQLKKAEEGVAQTRPKTEAVLGSLKGFLERLRKRVEIGIPWKIEQRLGVIDQALQLISVPNAQPVQSLQTVARIYMEEEALGRLVESTTMEVSLGQERMAVQAFHLGLLGVIFANEDGSVLGFAQAGQKLEDGLAATRGNSLAADGYLVAVDILRRRRTPSIVDLYLPTLATGQSGKKEEAK